MSHSDASQSADMQTFTKRDLHSLKENLDQPQDEEMLILGQLTLKKVSPFKLSKGQTVSLASFMNLPWPERGETVIETFRVEDWRQYKSKFLKSPVPISMALGLMTILGTRVGAVKVKLSTLLGCRKGQIEHASVREAQRTSQFKLQLGRKGSISEL